MASDSFHGLGGGAAGHWVQGRMPRGGASEEEGGRLTSENFLNSQTSAILGIIFSPP